MNEWVWSNGGMILTGENWSTGRKTFYSVGGRWMNEYGAMVEWYWQGKTDVLGEKQYTACMVDEWMSISNGGMILTGKTEVLGEKHTAWVVDEWMSMEQWWNDTDRGKPNYSRKTCPSDISSTTNLKCTDGWNVRLSGDRPMSQLPVSSTASNLFGKIHKILNIYAQITKYVSGTYQNIQQLCCEL